MKKTSKKKQETVESIPQETEEISVDSTDSTTDSTTKRSIGYALATMREKKSLSLDQVAINLNISERYISAIESMDRGGLPERVYTLGFVRSYARYLGVDPQKSVDQFKREVYDGFQAQNINMPEPLKPIEKPKAPLVAATLIMGVATWFAFEYFTGENATGPQRTAVESRNYETKDPIKALEENAVQNAVSSDPVSYQENSQGAPGDIPETSTIQGPETTSQNTGNGSTSLNLNVTGTQNTQTQNPTDEPAISVNPTHETTAQTTPEVTHPKLNQITFQFDQKTWLEIKKGAQVLISKNFQAGESYSFPMSNDLSISTQDSKAFKVLINGQSHSFETFGPKLTNFNIRPDRLVTPAESPAPKDADPKVQ